MIWYLQVASAIKEIVTRAGSDSSPHILCGDFNSEAGSPPRQLACDGYLGDTSIQKLRALENLTLADGSVSANLLLVVFIVMCLHSLYVSWGHSVSQGNYFIFFGSMFCFIFLGFEIFS